MDLTPVGVFLSQVELNQFSRKNKYLLFYIFGMRKIIYRFLVIHSMYLHPKTFLTPNEIHPVQIYTARTVLHYLG